MININQFFEALDGALRHIPVVLDANVDLAPADAAARIDVLFPDSQGRGNCLADNAGRAAERHHGTEHEFVVRDPGVCRQRAAEGQCGECAEAKALGQLL